MKKANKQGGPFQFQQPTLTLAERKILLKKQKAERDADALDAAKTRATTRANTPKKPIIDDEDA
jgi:hypothetical protein